MDQTNTQTPTPAYSVVTWTASSSPALLNYTKAKTPGTEQSGERRVSGEVGRSVVGCWYVPPTLSVLPSLSVCARPTKFS
jgi:hypothetical protein